MIFQNGAIYYMGIDSGRETEIELTKYQKKMKDYGSMQMFG